MTTEDFAFLQAFSEALTRRGLPGAALFAIRASRPNGIEDVMNSLKLALYDAREEATQATRRSEAA